MAARRVVAGVILACGVALVGCLGVRPVGTAVSPGGPRLLAASHAPIAVQTGDILALTRRLSAQGLAGRLSGSRGEAIAHDLIQGEWEAAGLEVVTQDVAIPGGRSRNVAGLIRGSDRLDDAPAAFVLAAHTDHLGVRGGQVYPGAGDNALGVAVLSEVGRILHARTRRGDRPVQDIVLLACTGQEQGATGLRAFLKNPVVPGPTGDPISWSASHVRTLVSLDGLAAGPTRRLYVDASGLSPAERQALSKGAVAPALNVVFKAYNGGHPTVATQSEPVGVQRNLLLFAGEAGDALWHTPDDRLDEGPIPARFSPDWLDAVTRAVLAVVDVWAYEATPRRGG